MDEKSYFDDHEIRVTNQRLDFRKETIPVDRISALRVKYKVFHFVWASSCFLVSLLCLTLSAKIGYLLVSLAFIYLFYVFQSYVSIWIVEGDKEIFVVHANMINSNYVYAVEEALKEAMYDNSLSRQKGELKYSDSLKFILKLKQYE